MLSQEERLVVVAGLGLVDELKEILKNGTNPGYHGDEGNTALHMAAKECRGNIVEILLQQGCSVNVTNDRKQTPLMYAAWKGHCSIVELLLAADCDVGLQDKEGYTALQMACRSGKQEVVSLLLETGKCSVQTCIKWGQSVLHDAAKWGHTECLRMLLDAGANPDATDRWTNTPLMYATLHGHQECLEHCLSALLQLHLHSRLNTWLHPIGQRQRQDETRRYRRETFKFWDLLRLILEVQLLVRAGCDTSIVNQGCRNAMHMATQSGHTDIVEILLRAGVDINMQDNDMNSPLLLAGHYKNRHIMTMLVQAGCDLEKRNKFSKTAFHFAALHGFKDLIDLMLQRGARPDLPDNNGNTALFFAVRRNYVEIVKTLLSLNCDIHRPCFIAGREYNMIQAALEAGHSELVKLLIEAGGHLTGYYTGIAMGKVHYNILQDYDFSWYLHESYYSCKSLLHLCRCTIRRHLSTNIHQELNSLILPLTLKDYLLLKDLI